ncbi:transposable element Tcb1 transposase [Trichonephila clavipes]|nr:transposable element Tcb1 transposase [Trichonephila clavipes]
MEAGWSARRVACQKGHSDCVGKEVLGPVDPRDVIYTKTRVWTPSTEHSSRRPSRRKKCTRSTNCFIVRHPGTPSLEAPVSSRTIRRRLAKGHLGSRCPLRVLPLAPTHRRLRLEWCRARVNWTAAEWNQIVFSDESTFNFSSGDNRVCVWRPRGERLNPAFVLQRRTTPTAGVMVWGAIAYNTRSPLVLIRGTMTPQRYVHDILQPHVLPLIQQLPFFSKTMLGLTRQGYHNTVSVLLLPFSDLRNPQFVSNRPHLGSFGTVS